MNTLYQVPVGKGKRFSTGNSIVDYVVGNWQFNNIFLAHSGLPYTVFVSSDIANTGNVGWVGYETMDLVGSPNLSKRTPAEWFIPQPMRFPPDTPMATRGGTRNGRRLHGTSIHPSSVSSRLGSPGV